MKLLLIAASLVLLGGCVAPGYYVQPDYPGGGGYYGDGYYESSGGYYPDYYGGNSAGLSIGYGYGYGDPGYYGWGSYPYGYNGYYGSYGGYYGYGRYHHGDGHHHGDHHHGGHDWDGHGHHRDSGWNGGDPHDGRTDARPWRKPDRAPIPFREEAMRTGGSAPQPRMISPDLAPHSTPQFSRHFEPRSRSGATRHDAPPVQRVAPHQPDKRKTQEF
ncbi:MAG TPA: hypothetical protein VFP88_08875 [Rhodanobacteraceae bacterium]|nr:hypothetical protein [Rhodanobacteraceae bacterium]